MNIKDKSIFLHGVLLGKSGNTHTPFKTSLSELTQATDFSEFEVVTILKKLQYQGLLTCIIYDDEVCLQVFVYVPSITVG